MSTLIYQAVVLAGERQNSNPLAQHFGTDAGVLVDVEGKSCIDRVLDCLQASQHIRTIAVAGPAPEVLSANPELQHRLNTAPDIQWFAPQNGPAASALEVAEQLDTWPAVLTSGDHALLNQSTLDQFCQDAHVVSLESDVVVGFVPYATVINAYPDTLRTRLRFRNGDYCGSNLFILKTAQSKSVLAFWQTVERLRKQPWKMAARLGLPTLIKYLCGQLTVDEAMARLSILSGCTISWVTINDPRAAVDVDSLNDWTLASAILAEEQSKKNHAGQQ